MNLKVVFQIICYLVNSFKNDTKFISKIINEKTQNIYQLKSIYNNYMSGRLIALDKSPGIRPARHIIIVYWLQLIYILCCFVDNFGNEFCIIFETVYQITYYLEKQLLNSSSGRISVSHIFGKFVCMLFWCMY